MSDRAPFFSDNESIVLTSNGIWMADGIEITHEGTQKLFAKNLVHKNDGYYVEVSRESKKINVEDTPYFVTRVDGTPVDGFKVTLNDDSVEKLEGEALSYRPGRLICKVKGGKAEAKFLHRAYFDFLKWLEEDGKNYFISLQGRQVVLAPRSRSGS